MTRHAPCDPEPFEIELVPLDADHDGAAGRSRRPPPGGAGTLPSAADVVQRVVARALAVPDPPLSRDRHQIQPWADLRVHRLVRLPSAEAARALQAVLSARGGQVRAPAPHRTRHHPGPRVTSSPAAFLDVGHLPSSGAVRTRRGALHVHRRGRPTPVEIVLEPWSDDQTDLCLQVRPRRRRVHLPRRYFDVAHLVMDELWHQIEAAATA